jgi:hypothetical protein
MEEDNTERNIRLLIPREFQYREDVMKLSERMRALADRWIINVPISYQIQLTEWVTEVAHLEAENAEMKCKLIEAEHSLQHALSAINDALKEGE